MPPPNAIIGLSYISHNIYILSLAFFPASIFHVTCLHVSYEYIVPRDDQVSDLQSPVHRSQYKLFVKWINALLDAVLYWTSFSSPSFIWALKFISIAYKLWRLNGGAWTIVWWFSKCFILVQFRSLSIKLIFRTFDYLHLSKLTLWTDLIKISGTFWNNDLLNLVWFPNYFSPNQNDFLNINKQLSNYTKFTTRKEINKIYRKRTAHI